MQTFEMKNHIDQPETKSEVLKSTKVQLLSLQKDIETNNKITLSKNDFQKYFAGENFQQRSIWNCRLLAAIDSLVSRGGYENAIRKSIILTKNWDFLIRLPLGDPKAEQILVKKEDIKNQININGTKAILVDGKLGIKALVYAYGKYTTKGNRNGNFWFDYHNLTAGKASVAFNTLLEGVEVFFQGRSKKWIKNEKEDPEWKYDRGFMESFKKVLINFNSNSDMMTISVYQKNEESWDRNNKKDSYESLGHYSRSNHSVSVEKTFQKNWKLYIRLSNPWDSKRFYDISFWELLKSCSRFHLASNQKWKFAFIKEKQNHEKEKSESRKFSAKDTKMPDSLNQAIQTTWKFNKKESIWRGDVVVTQTAEKELSIEGWGRKDAQLTWQDKTIEIKINELKLKLNKGKLSETFKNTHNKQYPVFLYWPRIALFIQKMRNLYMKEKIGKGENPFQMDKLWDIVFIPNLSKIWSGNLMQDIGGIVSDITFNIIGEIWEKGGNIKNKYYSTEQRTVTVLKNRNLLWIDPHDTEIKQKIINFLNQLYNKN